MTMESLLSTATALVTSGITWAGQFVTFITENPLVLVYALLPLVGLGVGLLTRNMRVN